MSAGWPFAPDQRKLTGDPAHHAVVEQVKHLVFALLDKGAAVLVSLVLPCLRLAVPDARRSLFCRFCVRVGRDVRVGAVQDLVVRRLLASLRSRGLLDGDGESVGGHFSSPRDRRLTSSSSRSRSTSISAAAAFFFFRRFCRFRMLLTSFLSSSGTYRSIAS